MTLDRVLAVFPPLTLGVFLLPVVLGLLGTWLPAFGILPAVGADQPSLAPWRTLFTHPSLVTALRHTLISAWGSTLLALVLTLVVLSLGWKTRSFRWLQGSLSGLLAIPHAAFAIGLMLLLAPSGWLVRLISPELTGWDYPPLFSLTGDSWGVGLTLVLTLKEMPFLLLMALAGLQNLRVEATLRMTRSLGYADAVAWWRVILPQLVPLMRLPVFAVLAFGLSVVDVAQIAGPGTPGTLAVLLDSWFRDPDLTLRLPASAGATLLLLVTLLSIALWWVLEGYWLTWTARRAQSGQRRYPAAWLTRPAPLLSGLLLLTTLATFVVLLLWSLAFRWSFPEALPETWTVRFWARGWAELQGPLWLTLGTGLVAAVLGLILVVGCLEHEVTLRRKRPEYRETRVLWLIYLPLIVPQVAFLFGVQVALVRLNLDGHWLALVWVHLVFVVPYLFLSLSGPYRSFDEGYRRQAVWLSGSQWKALWRVKWPMLLRPLGFALAIGFAVSLAQYLPTLYAGNGRFATLTTETVGLALGGDRRLVGVYALFQWLLPMLVYSLAILVPAWCFRHRRGMRN